MKFLEAGRQDPSLQEKLRAEGADPVAIAKKAGYSVTKAELPRAQARHVQNLSDEELESAAGGTTGDPLRSLLAEGLPCSPEASRAPHAPRP